MAPEDNEFIISPCGDTEYDGKILFSTGQKFLFCCDGSTVNVYAIQTGDCIQQLRHTEIVIAVEQDPEARNQIFTCTTAGKITVWAFESGVKKKEWRFKAHEVSVFLFAPKLPRFYYFVEKSHKKTYLRCVDVADKQADPVTKTVGVPAKDSLIDIHNSGQFVAFAVGAVLHVLRVDSQSDKKRFFRAGDVDISVVRCHPTDDLVAVSDGIGRIFLWQQIFWKGFNYTLCHWHTWPAADIAFSFEGATMLSGGAERTLVKWQLQNSTRRREGKDFLPRMDGAIRRLAMARDGSLYAACLDDSSIIVVNSFFRTVCNIRGRVRYKSPSNATFPVLLFDDHGCAGQMTKNCLISSGRTGQLQFYDPCRDKQLFCVDIVGENFNTSIREKKVINADIENAAVYQDWLATTDQWLDPTGDYCKEINLKFWKFDEESKEFRMMTWVRSPHLGRVTFMIFHFSQATSSLSLITTSDDGKFKVWMLSPDDDKKTDWNVTQVGYYREQPALMCDIVPENDTLAVVFGSTLTVWPLQEHRMTTAFSVASADDLIKSAQFGQDNLIAVHSKQYLGIWDLETQLCIWRLSNSPQLVCRHPTQKIFAAISDSQVCIFRLTSPKCFIRVERKSSAVARVGVFASGYNSAGWFRLFYVSDDEKLSCVHHRDDDAIGFSVKSGMLLDDTFKATPFAELMASTKAEKIKQEARSNTYNYAYNIKLLSGSAHTLPAISVIGPRFVESFLLPPTDTEERTSWQGITFPEGEVTITWLNENFSKL